MSVTPYPGPANAQPYDATLQALAALGTSADTAPYFSGVDVAALMTVTPLARTLLDDTTQAAMQATLGLGTMATQNANAVAITGGNATLTDAIITGTLNAASRYIPNKSGDNVYGIYSELQAAGGTGRYLIYSSTAPSYFGGEIIANSNITGQERGGNSQYGFATTLNAAGGTDRFAVKCVGTAPSYFGGTVQVVGQVAIGTEASTNPLTIRYQRTFQNGLVMIPDADSGGSAMYFTNAASVAVGTISTTASATFYNTSSDIRLKHNIQPLTNVLDCIRALRPISHLWNADGSYGEGFLAHELMQQVPLAVTGEPDAVDAHGHIVPQQVDHSKLVPWLTAGLQAALAQIDALTARVATLEAALGA